MAFLVLGANSVSGYTVKNSLRFNSGSSDYLNRTSSGGSSQIATFSTWIKRSTLSSEQHTISFNNNTDNNQMNLKFTSGDKIQFSSYTSAAYQFNFVTTQLFRDVSAWYHIVGAVDTTQATNTNRVKLYVNGTQVTAFDTATYPSQNANLIMNGNAPYTYLGIYRPTFFYLNGYLSETIWIDGQQLDPTSFGETDTDTGIWKPKAYTGTYGTNGFYLKFANSASLGTDSSGNGNTFTVNNLTSVDQTTDTPTNNFCTLNALSKGSDITLTNGNTTATRSSASWNSVMSTIGVSKGKWYWEAKVVSLGIINFGVTKTTQDGTTHSSVDAGRVMYSSNGTVYDEGFANSPIATGTTFTTNDIIGLALDCDSGTLKFYKNGTLINTYSNAGLTTNEVTPANGIYNAVGDMNFGNPQYSANSYTDGAGYGNFSYSVPSGYYSLCTKNLATYG